MPVGARIDVLTLCSRALRSSRIDVTRRAMDGPGGPASAAAGPRHEGARRASCRPRPDRRRRRGGAAGVRGRRATPKTPAGRGAPRRRRPSGRRRRTSRVGRADHRGQQRLHVLVARRRAQPRASRTLRAVLFRGSSLVKEAQSSARHSAASQPCETAQRRQDQGVLGPRAAGARRPRTAFARPFDMPGTATLSVSRKVSRATRGPRPPAASPAGGRRPAAAPSSPCRRARPRYKRPSSCHFRSKRKTSASGPRPRTSGPRDQDDCGPLCHTRTSRPVDVLLLLARR